MKLIIKNNAFAKVGHPCKDVECENARCRPLIRFITEPSAEWHHGNPFRYERAAVEWTCKYCETINGSLRRHCTECNQHRPLNNFWD